MPALDACAGKDAPVPAELALEREDLIATVRALHSIEGPVAGEVTAAKQAWPSIANGLPPASASLRAPVARALARAQAVPVPALFGEARSRLLTGPAFSIAGTYRTFAELATRGWQLIDADARAIQGGTRSGARFARATVALYLESVYDAHFALAQIGAKVHKAFHDLGAAEGFAGAITQAEVDALESFYSEANDRLHPHVGVRLGS